MEGEEEKAEEESSAEQEKNRGPAAIRAFQFQGLHFIGVCGSVRVRDHCNRRLCPSGLVSIGMACTCLAVTCKLFDFCLLLQVDRLGNGGFYLYMVLSKSLFCLRSCARWMSQISPKSMKIYINIRIS